MNRKEHWNEVYQANSPDDVSWYQVRPEVSLAMIADTGMAKDSGIIDVGSGASSLTNCLLDTGYSSLAVLDVSGATLSHAQVGLGERAVAVEWFETDVTSFQPPHRFAVWHDRAMFHFLTAPSDRRGYVSTLQRTLEPGGHVIIATFAVDGPPKCSGLPVVRYDESSIVAEFGASFVLRDSKKETHRTPWATEQRFVYFRFQQVSAES